MRPRRKWFMALVLVVMLTRIPAHGTTQTEFPEWRAGFRALGALWEETPIVAVGEVKNVRFFGQQYVEHLPAPVKQNLHYLYWCSGEFHLTSVIKGAIPSSPKKYLWGSVNPGCELFYGSAEVGRKNQARVWFLREEGEYLRPTLDGSAFYYIGLRLHWNDSPKVIPAKQFAELLLTPAATSDTLADFANSFWEQAAVACSLLPREDCTRRLRQLSDAGEATLRDIVCTYLRTELRQPCESPQ